VGPVDEFCRGRKSSRSSRWSAEVQAEQVAVCILLCDVWSASRRGIVIAFSIVVHGAPHLG
jgi:phage-related protein